MDLPCLCVDRHGPWRMTIAEPYYFVLPHTEGALNQASILMTPIAMATGFPNLLSFVTSGTQKKKRSLRREACNEVMEVGCCALKE